MSDCGWRTLPFSVGQIGPELHALFRAVPLLDQVLCELETRHEPRLAEDRVLRNHYRELADSGSFRLQLLESGAVLRSGVSAMLDDKAEFHGVLGRRDLMLVASRVGFGHPLCAVALPLHRVAIPVLGARWNIDGPAAARALARFEAAGIDWSAPPGPDVAPALVVGDQNYAHHAWNQLGALATVLARHPRQTVFATHQPLGPIQELFADAPGLTVTTLPARDLPGIDLQRFRPYAPGGKVVLATVRERVRRLAARRASPEVLDFCARMAAERRRMAWLTVRVRDKTAVNLAEALAALAEALLRRGDWAVVLDGFGVPEDFAANGDYDNAAGRGMIARERLFAQGVVGMVRDRLGEAALRQVFVAVGGRLLDSIHLAGQCHAYFAHHGTLQHRIGYFTTVPGMVHACPGILQYDRAATLRDVAPECGAVQYIDPALIDDVVPRGGQAGGHDNPYRFNDIPALVAAFARFADAAGQPTRL